MINYLNSTYAAAADYLSASLPPGWFIQSSEGYQGMNPSRSSRRLADRGKGAAVGAVRTIPAFSRVHLGGAARPILPCLPGPDHWDSWRTDLRLTVLAKVADFVSERCAEALGACGVDVAGDILLEFV